MTNNYPPGVTGNEPEINGDASWEKVIERIESAATDIGMSNSDVMIAWGLGLAAWGAAKTLGLSLEPQNPRSDL